ncbi:MAG: hypothetical protein II007_14975 [Gammaproteobacteria bacterium]|nr:hypothetical protein [Gammaproteobacteria bacterium]
MSLRPDLLLLVDYSPAIGTGHLMRCLTVVEWLRLASPHSLAIRLLAPALPLPLVEHCQRLGVEISTPEPQRPLAAQVAALQPRLLLIDGYGFDPSQLQALAATGITLALFDDLNDRGPLPAALVINPSPLAQPDHYPSVAQVLTGCQFAPLRAEFSRQPYVAPSQRQRLLINCGGSDPLALSQPLAALALGKLPDEAGVDLVTGAACPHATAVGHWCSGLSTSRLRHHHAIATLAEVGASARLAVVALGNTLYELCALGTPVLGLWVAANQRPTAMALAGQGIIDSYGADERDALGERLQQLWQQPQLLDQRAERQRQLVDGRGGERIASAIRQLLA